MNAKERFKTIVESIEEMVIANELTDHEISDKAFDNANFPKEDREKNVLFEFLLEKKVLEYISERRLMAGYKLLLTVADKDNAYKGAWALSRSSNQPGFISKFKKMFKDYTPLEARMIADPSLYKPIPTWESISGEDKETNEDMKDMVFDIPREQFESIQKAMNLQEFYSFNKEESEFAYFMSKDGTDMEKAFEYVANYFGGNQSEDRDNRLEQDLSRKEVKYLYFDCGLGFNDIFTILLMQYLKQIRIKITDCDSQFLKSCLEYVDGKMGILAKDDKVSFQEKYDYYMKSATDKYTEFDLQLYIYYLRTYDHKKAFSMLSPGIEDKRKLKKIIMKHKGIEDDYEKYLDMYEGEIPDDNEHHYGEIEDNSIYSCGRFYDEEPDFGEEGYMGPAPDDPDMEEEEGSWLLDAYEGPEINEEPRVYYDELYFDVSEFERLCMEMSDFEEGDITDRSSFGKRLTEHHDLDVESYWEENKEVYQDVSAFL